MESKTLTNRNTIIFKLGLSTFETETSAACPYEAHSEQYVQ